MDFTITHKKNNLAGLDAALRRELHTALDHGAHAVEAEAKQNIVEMGAVDTGAMLNSGTVQPAGDLARRIVFTADYSLYVHEGHRTRGGSHVPGRPFLSKAVDEARPDIMRELAAIVERAAR